MKFPMMVAAAVTGLATAAHVCELHAAEVKVVSGGPFKAALTELLPGYAGPANDKITVRYEAMEPLLAELEAGATDDVVILSIEAMAVAVKRGRIDEVTIAQIARVGVGVGVKQGAAFPDVSTPASFKATLLAATSVAATDPTKGTSGKHFAEVLAKLGIADAMKTKLKLVDGGYGSELVAKGEAEMVVQPTTTIIPAKGVAYVGPVPGDLQKLSLYEGALTKSAKGSPAAKAFLAHLLTPTARAAFVKQGFEK